MTKREMLALPSGLPIHQPCADWMRVSVMPLNHIASASSFPDYDWPSLTIRNHQGQSGICQGERMSLKYLSALLLSLTVFTSAAQPCDTARTSYYSIDVALQDIRQIYKLLCPTGCGHITIKAGGISNNAQAKYLRARETEISYDPEWMGYLARTYGESVPFAILAHELGHHIDFNKVSYNQMTAWQHELSADAWAGCALALAHMGTSEFEQAMRYSMAVSPSKTHPGWQKRNKAIQGGYWRCR